jgi:hypothetical protein
MTIGGGIALVAIGAILTFAVNFTLAGLNLDVVGVILMLAGAVIVVLGLMSYSASRRVVRTTETPVTEVRREQRVIERDPPVV